MEERYIRGLRLSGTRYLAKESKREMEIYKQQNETVSATNPLFNTWLFKRYGILWALEWAWQTFF